jgi:serine/threonine-protein kinase RsbW
MSLLKTRKANMSNNIDELPESGRGIKIMSHLADQLSYTRTPEHKNCLFIVKNYEPQGLNQSQALQKGSLLEQLIDFFNLLNWFKYKELRKSLCNFPLQRIHLQVNTDLKELEQILEWFDQLEHLPIPKTVWFECKLVLAESFTNAVCHAHKDLPCETPIELEVTVFNDSLEMRILDYGQPFDLEAKLSELREIDREQLEHKRGRVLEFT